MVFPPLTVETHRHLRPLFDENIAWPPGGATKSSARLGVLPAIALPKERGETVAFRQRCRPSTAPNPGYDGALSTSLTSCAVKDVDCRVSRACLSHFRSRTLGPAISDATASFQTVSRRTHPPKQSAFWEATAFGGSPLLESMPVTDQQKNRKWAEPASRRALLPIFSGFLVAVDSLYRFFFFLSTASPKLLEKL